MTFDGVRFIILSDARTGSNLLVDSLNANPHVRCFREIFNMQLGFVDYAVDGFDGRDPAEVELRDNDFKRLLADRIFADAPRGVRAVGFKFHYNHFWAAPGLIEHLAADTSLRIVHLRRANLLRALVSLRIAEQTGGWMQPDVSQLRRNTLRRNLTPARVLRAATHPSATVRGLIDLVRPPQPQTKAERQLIHLTHDDCVRYFYTVEHNAKHFTGLLADHPVHELWYEDLASDRQATVDAVAAFLDVPPAPARSTLKRQNPEHLRDLIANYDELRATFAGTPTERFFD